MLDKNKIPTHIAVIMDGNGRWATAHGVPRLSGHNAGMKAMKEIIKRSDVLGVKYLTVYAFSTENWKRSTEEVSGIFKLLVKYVDSELAELNENNVRVHILGDYSRLPEDARERVETAIRGTHDNSGLQFNIALNYGGRDEIVRAVKSIAEDVAKGIIAEADIEETVNEELIGRRLFTGDANGNIPDPELVIRTSGEQRTSNYLIWQSAYSEYVFTDVLWPDFTPEEYEKCIEEFQGRNRRFGGR